MSFDKPVMLWRDASVCVLSDNVTKCWHHRVRRCPNPHPIPYLSLLLSVSLSRLRPASRKQTDVKQKPRPLMHPALVLSHWFMCVNGHVEYAAWFRKQMRLNERVIVCVCVEGNVKPTWKDEQNAKTQSLILTLHMERERVFTECHFLTVLYLMFILLFSNTSHNT